MYLSPLRNICQYATYVSDKNLKFERGRFDFSRIDVYDRRDGFDSLFHESLKSF